MKEYIGSIIHRDSNGKEVEVTSVHPTMESAKEIKWEDAQIVSTCLVGYVKDAVKTTQMMDYGWLHPMKIPNELKDLSDIIPIYYNKNKQ
jgi:hypothetical protein